jgi:predicted DNA-binding helix-hairpin-helix protein
MHVISETRGGVFCCLLLLTMPRIFINNCSIEELMSVPGIGAKVADKILELREAKGDLELDEI